MADVEESTPVASSALTVVKNGFKDVSRLLEELLLKIISKTKGKELQVGAGLLLFGVHVYYYRKFTYWSRRKVKSPRPLPIVGNLLSLVLYPYQECSDEWLKKYGKVYGMYSGSSPQLVIADAKVVKQICIKDFDKFPNHNFFNVPNKYQKNFLIIQKDDHWRSMRALISPTFTSGRMKAMYKIFSQCADDMIEQIHKELDKNQPAVINSRSTAGAFTIGSAVGSFYGIKLNDQGPENRFSKQYFSKRSREAFSPQLARFLLQALLPSALVQYVQFSEFSSKRLDFFFEKAKAIVSDRLKSKERHNDYLQLLIEARADGHLDEFDVERHSDHYTLNNNELDEQSELRSSGKRLKLTEWEVACQVVMLMLVATETTAALVSHTIFLLAHHRDIQERLYAELADIRKQHEDHAVVVHFDYDDVASHQYLDCVISEVLRLMPPALRVDRKANQDYLIEEYGIRVQKDMIVYLDIHGLHHNPEYWPQPNKFDPERFSAENKHKIVTGSFSPFGVGPRACIGFRFALTEAKVAIAKLISEFIFHPAEGSVYPAKPDKPFFVGALYKDLRVSVTSRKE